MKKIKITPEQVSKANEELIRGGQLEEIFWKSGKFFSNQGKELNPQTIGNPVIASTFAIPGKNQEERVLYNLGKLILEDKIYENANAYSLGKSLNRNLRSTDALDSLAPVQFYKI